MVKSDNILNRWFTEVWNEGHEAAIDDILAPDCVLHGLAPQHDVQLRGREAFREFYRGLRPQFSRIHIDIQHSLVDGDLHAARCRVTGTHAATGRDVNFCGMAVVEVKDGHVVEAWNHFDFPVMEGQISGQLAA
jgi:predicted ester cyclase